MLQGSRFSKKIENFIGIISGFIIGIIQIDHGESKNRVPKTLGSILRAPGSRLPKLSQNFKDLINPSCFGTSRFYVFSIYSVSDRKGQILSLEDHDFRIPRGRFGLYLLRNHEIMT